MSSDDSTNAMDSRRRDAQTPVPAPGLFMPHFAFSDEVNRIIAQSEIEGGVCLDALSEGPVLRSKRSIIGTRSSIAPAARH
jgi:hypothetical protein